MKFRFILLPLLVIASSAAHAGIVYSGIQNIPIPLTFPGIYFRIDTGATSPGLPADFNTAPWLNPFFGGLGIGNSPLLRPVIIGTDQVLNLAPGTLIAAASNFVAGASGSSTHAGVGAGQFVLDTPGYLGAAFRSSVGGPEHYGWINLDVNNDGSGRIISWAYDDVSGTSIRAGVIPEPGTAFFGLGLVLVALTRRARSRQGTRAL